jgi:hypothetical protein
MYFIKVRSALTPFDEMERYFKDKFSSRRTEVHIDAAIYPLPYDNERLSR